ncbi:MAG: glycoside hydrolase [Prevotella sp.]|nr:glycoside hydrolase [Prevotella sp.]
MNEIAKMMTRRLFEIICCMMSAVAWGQAKAVGDTIRYEVNPQEMRQHFEGWGVSLCWWAGQCGKWSDEKIDEIVTWLVSPEGLNYNIFRYNIGGGDDPQNRHCELHHMGRGKGLRAEMEGFKDSIGDRYHWERDAAQRKIMLKIKEKRPDAVFEAFSNSCPYYMTYSGCVAGHQDGGKDNLRPEYYEAFAHYLVDVCKHYKDKYGIEFKTLAPFNESASNYWHANGSQEGCHFDYESQVRFIHVLEPILRASGLSTVISAADETSVGHAIDGLKYYVSTGADRCIGQWNTHTYGGSILEKVRYGALARATGKHLWMSETGAGGNGIAGNLKLAQRLIDDMRYIQPEAWIDWQYMEEANDQWCTIRGSFAGQTYEKVKNYYVRQQCSRFIKQGYDIITTVNNQSLAAVSANRDTLVIVALNEGTAAKTHVINLSQFSQMPVGNNIRAYRTSAEENLSDASHSVSLDGKTLIMDLPAQSITTLVVIGLYCQSDLQP